MLIHAETLIHLNCVSLYSGRKTQTSIHLKKTKIISLIQLWSDCADTEIQLSPRTVHTQRDYVVSVTHPAGLWQLLCSHTSVILAGAAWFCKQWQHYQKKACGERESKNETEKSTTSAGDFRDHSQLTAGHCERAKRKQQSYRTQKCCYNRRTESITHECIKVISVSKPS